MIRDPFTTRNLNPERKRQPSWRVVLWLCLVTLLAYINVTANKFVLDDKYFLVENYALRQPLLLFSPWFKAIPLVVRPAMFLSLALDYRVWGLDPAGFHLTNLLLHLLNVLLVYGVALRLTGGRFFAPLAGLLFALHPVHSEAVAAMVGRSDLMVTMFSLVGLLAYQRFIEDKGLLRRGLFFLLTLLSYGAACLTKENGIVLPLLLVISENLLWKVKDRGRGLRAQALSIVPFLVVGALYIGFRQMAVPPSEQTVWGGGAWQTALLMMMVLWKYLVLLVFPFPLSPYYISYWPVGWGYAEVLGGLLALLGGVFVAFRYTRLFPLLSWAVAWIGISLLPVSNIIPIPGAMMAERWLYPPSVGFCVFMAWGVSALLARSHAIPRRILIAFGFIVLTLFTIRIVTWNPVWRDERSLNQTVLRKNPESVLARVNMGNYFYLAGRYREAEEEYLGAFRLNPLSAEVHLNLGNVLCAEGEILRGIGEFRRSLVLDSTMVPAWFALGTAYQGRGVPDSALLLYQRVLKLDPLNVPALNNSGIIYLEKEEYQHAEESFRRALFITPDDSLLKANFSRALQLRTGQMR